MKEGKRKNASLPSMLVKYIGIVSKPLFLSSDVEIMLICVNSIHAGIISVYKVPKKNDMALLQKGIFL